MGTFEKPKPPPPKAPEEHPRERVEHHAASRAAAGPAAPTPAAAEGAPTFFADIGVSLDSTGTEGVAVATARPVATALPTIEPPKPKVLSARVADVCPEQIIKAHPERVEQPEYTLAARSARVEGRVLIELQVDETGNVTSTKLITGLGYGLDEAALEAVKNVHFRPATLCGKPVAAPFVMAMRFVLGE